MNPIEEFKKERQERIDAQENNSALKTAAENFMNESFRAGYSYNFTWLGRPVIQYPQDMMVMQEIIWAVKPDLIIETGIAHGGSLIFSASMLELIGGEGEVLGIDVDIRAHNKKEIELHPMFRRISMIEGSSVDEEIISRVREKAKTKKNILVILDSNHTHEHVLSELKLYSPLVSLGSYLIVMDTVIENLSPELIVNRPWKRGDSPKTAVREFLKMNENFVTEKDFQNKILISVAPDGYLKRVNL